MDREMSRSYRADLNGSNSHREAIEEKKTFLMNRETVEKYQDCDKEQLKSSTDKPGIERCKGCFKIVFQKREKHKHKCNQTCNLTKDPNNNLTSQQEKC